MDDAETFDYVVVGSGSAGAVVARRLSDAAGCSVLLLEAGGGESSWKIQIPSAYAYPLADPRFSWRYETEPQPRLGGRRVAWPAGRVLGGSSSINGMVFLRGHPGIFDEWAQEAPGWAYADVLPYFKRAESREAGGDTWRGGDGPLAVAAPRWRTPLFSAFIDAGVQAGYARTRDFNGEHAEGFGPFEMTVDRGTRASTYRAYLRPVRGRRNLAIRAHAAATRIVLEGRRAVGVHYVMHGKTRTVRAGKEVILCAGAVNTPRLLLLSGIGPAEELGALGIPVIHNLPGVGRNLQDHLELYIQFRCKQPVSLYPYLSLPGKIRIGAEWYLARSGLCTTNHAEAGALIRRPGAAGAVPDVQFHFVPMAIDYHGRSPVADHSFQVHAGPTRQTSVGRITLASKDPLATPTIDPNYLDTEDDRAAMRDCVRMARQVIAQPAMSAFAGAELAPGAAVQSDEALDAFIQAGAESGYHYGGTCRMGRDAMAVTDELGRVRGVGGLRVADASLMPRIVNCNTNAPTIMIGEKIADHVLGRSMLATAEPAHGGRAKVAAHA